MVARVQSSGHKTLGLLLHHADVHRYFPENIRFVELLLGELCIGCRLEPDFWNSHPVIADPRLCDWFDFKVFHEMARRGPPSLELTPCGTHRFQVCPLSADGDSAPIGLKQASPGCMAGMASLAQPLHFLPLQEKVFVFPPLDEAALLIGKPASRKDRDGDSHEIDWTQHSSGNTRRWSPQRASRAGVGG